MIDPLRRLPSTERVEGIRQEVAATYGLRPFDRQSAESVNRPIAELFARLILLEERLAAAEGTVTRCGYCGAPLASCTCLYCGAENKT